MDTKPTQLPESLNSRLRAYALAASAAGVGLLALAEPAQANIVVDTTPISIGVNSTEYLTINGVHQLQFINSSIRFGSSGELNLFGPGHVINTPLPLDALIGPGGPFTTRGTNLARNSVTVANGPWANQTGYLGFEFVSHSQTYFGWAHLKVTASGIYGDGETGYISEFAYETDPNTAIKAGETAGEPGTPALVLMALGALGLGALRKRRATSATPKQPTEV